MSRDADGTNRTHNDADEERRGTERRGCRTARMRTDAESQPVAVGRSHRSSQHTILLIGEDVSPAMAEKPTSGEILGVPYNFERPSISRMLSSYWQPGEGMLVEKPFGVGYTLNLANWRSWVVVLVAGGLLWQQESPVRRERGSSGRTRRGHRRRYRQLRRSVVPMSRSNREPSCGCSGPDVQQSV